MPRKFNDAFALVLVLLIFATWSYVLIYGLDQAGVIVGATVMALGQITSFYWRKRPPDKPEVPHG